MVFSERGLGTGWSGGGVFMVAGVSARLQRFYLGIWSVRHLGGCFLKTQHK